MGIWKYFYLRRIVNVSTLFSLLLQSKHRLHEFLILLWQGLIEVIIEDNLKQELTSAYRSDLEDELGNKDDK